MKMRHLLFVIISLVFIGCGDGEDRVASADQAASANVVVPLAIGETRTFPLNLRVDESYLVTAQPKTTASNKIDYRVDYLGRTYPEIVVTGVSSGTEDFIVTAEDAGGRRQQALIRANVLSIGDINGTAIDIATDPNGGSGTDEPGGGDNGGGTTPPVINPISDPDACNDNDPTWGKVGDSWGTTEGQYSTDLHYWIRSLISEEPSSVTLYYKRVAVTKVEGYLALGSYTYNTSDGKTLRYEMQMLQELVGKSKYFYIKWRSDCYRGNVPTSILMAPDKTLTPVFSGSVF